MSEKLFWLATAVLLVIVVAGATWFFTAEEPKEAIMSGTQGEAVQKFTDECMGDLLRRGALKYGNTTDQITSTCKCIGAEMYPMYKDMTHEEAAQFSKRLEERRRVVTVFQKCIDKIGLDGAEMWYRQLQ